MSADVTLALIGITVVMMVLLTYAAFRYVPVVLDEEEPEPAAGVAR